MSSLLGDEEINFNQDYNNLAKGEIELAKKASRAFAVCYVNEIYNTIKSLDPALLKRLKTANEYPYYLHLFIHQQTNGKIDTLDIYTEYKSKDDGFCEVREIYHCSECDGSYIEEKKRRLALRCMKWRLSQLELSKMYKIALCAGKRVGKSLHNFSNLTSRPST
ncbi:MAG: hypothetical protein JSW00_19340 [Thermoplasmata archaeon]|nr:MAG: hypothetical protein JSW00_19340 [Thermoplasmata archaeon]